MNNENAHVDRRSFLVTTARVLAVGGLTAYAGCASNVDPQNRKQIAGLCKVGGTLLLRLPLGQQAKVLGLGLQITGYVLDCDLLFNGTGSEAVAASIKPDAAQAREVNNQPRDLKPRNSQDAVKFAKEGGPTDVYANQKFTLSAADLEDLKANKLQVKSDTEQDLTASTLVAGGSAISLDRSDLCTFSYFCPQVVSRLMPTPLSSFVAANLQILGVPWQGRHLGNNVTLFFWGRMPDWKHVSLTRDQADVWEKRLKLNEAGFLTKRS